MIDRAKATNRGYRTEGLGRRGIQATRRGLSSGSLRRKGRQQEIAELLLFSVRSCVWLTRPLARLCRCRAATPSATSRSPPSRQERCRRRRSRRRDGASWFGSPGQAGCATTSVSDRARGSGRRCSVVGSADAAEGQRAMDDHDSPGYISVETVDPWQGYRANRQTLNYPTGAQGYKAKKKTFSGGRTRRADSQ